MNSIKKVERDITKKGAKLSANLIKDDKKLLKYLKQLDQDIESTEDLDRLAKEVTDNVLQQYKNFNDPRHLKSNNIEAINNLIKTRLDIKTKKLTSKKILFDILNKKRELEIKLHKVANENKVIDKVLDIKDLLSSLDRENIHPEITISEDDHRFIDDNKIELIK